MKTFEEEYQELWDWRDAQYDKSIKLPMDGTGLDDGQRCHQEMRDGQEYRRRLMELKKKYNRETA